MRCVCSKRKKERGKRFRILKKKSPREEEEENFVLERTKTILILQKVRNKQAQEVNT